MVDISLFDKFKLIFEFIKNNYFIALVILLIGVILFDLIYGNNKKQTKTLYILTIVLILIYTLFSYYKPLFNIIDVYITNIFKLAYFPSIIDYLSFIIITIIIQLMSIKQSNKIIKNMNIWVGFILEALFILNLIALNGINVDLSNVTKIYENDLLLSIFQITGILFIIWIFANIIILIINRFLEAKIAMPKLNDNY